MWRGPLGFALKICHILIPKRCLFEMDVVIDIIAYILFYIILLIQGTAFS